MKKEKRLEWVPRRWGMVVVDWHASLALWWSAESELVLLHVSGGGGDRYGTPLYGEVSCLFSMGRDRIGPTPMLLPLSLLRYGGSWKKTWNVKRETSSLHETRSTKFFVRPTNASHFASCPSKQENEHSFFSLSLKRRSSYESRKEVDDFQGGNETRGTRREIPAKSPR